MSLDKCKTCQSCLMPFSKDPGPRESEKYCSLCFKNRRFCYTGTDLKEFQKICYGVMIQKGMNKLTAGFFTFCIRFAPRWKNK